MPNQEPSRSGFEQEPVVSSCALVSESEGSMGNDFNISTQVHE